MLEKLGSNPKEFIYANKNVKDKAKLKTFFIALIHFFFKLNL